MPDDRAAILLAALVMEALAGYPAALHARIPHPVVWAGAGIAALEARWNHGSPRRRRALGMAALLLLGALVVAGGRAVEHLLSGWPLSIGLAAVATLGLAQRSLHQHVAAVARPLARGGLAAARMAVAKIVGRDTAALDAEGVATAAVESLSESLSDGIVAPAFWFLLAGLPGMVLYKLVNTADSMIGHRDARHADFGWAAARADDLMNLLPARLTAVLLALAAGPQRCGAALGTAWRDARRHPSPNAGWPEAAMAGALGVRLGGPACYDGVWMERPVLGRGRAASPHDLARALGLYRRACLLLWLLVGVLAWAA
jgi:adenosylcobinamide-phosphate synthase